MPIRVFTKAGGLVQMKASFSRNWKHYLQEGLGLGIFMISACLFSSLLEANDSSLHKAIPDAFVRNLLIGVLMGATALFIFYSPFTSPSGSQINPAVTLSFLRLGKMCPWDAVFYIIFQFIGGTLAVYIMQYFLGESLTNLPVNFAVTIPGRSGEVPALITEFIIAFITMTMVLFTSAHPTLKKYTRIFAACLVTCWVIIAGPISGFGMNPARSFASALPSNTWTAFWIYLIIPIAGMIAATELFFGINYKKWFFMPAAEGKGPDNIC
jgi:aquaporin Z